ncbi:MAG: hypothetical protein IJF92_03870 [Bacilli bacterium]|nr:hypothetical protein [Bacilli bacterium]
MTRTEINDYQLNLNKILGDMFKRNGIKNLNLVSVGNSIASGYSIQRTIEPLLLRNETIEGVMNSYGVNLERHAFARAQNNNEEHVFEWLTSNIKESEINKMVRHDYGSNLTSMPVSYLDSRLMNKYYPIKIKDDKGLLDIINNDDKETANILVYNGCTGSFLDNVTRGGKLSEMFTYGIKRDIKGLEATLKYIQNNNRTEDTNTQVYLCGAPDYLGLKITNIINNKLKKVAKQYANVTYVRPIKSKFFYHNIKDDKLGVDIHYDEEEYNRFNNNILSSIISNYKINKSMINVDRSLYTISKNIEVGKNNLIGNDEEIQSIVNDIVAFETINLNPEDKKKFLKNVTYYLNEREPYDFFYIGKKNIKEVIKEEKESHK